MSGWVLTDLCVPNWAFKNCENLKTVKMPTNTKLYDIKQEAFSGCTSLEEFDFSHIGIIDRYAFSDCSSLKQVDFENNSSCPYINDHSFSGCLNLEQVIFSSRGCQQFFMSAFEGCSSLTSIEWLSEIVPKIFDLQQSPYYGLWDKGFDAYNLPYGHVTFKMLGYIADECMVENDQEFWKKVQFDRIYETLTGECGDQGDNVTWSLDTKEGVLHISGSGYMKMPEDENVLTWKDRNRAVKQVDLGADIESICSNAFSGCPIKSITLNKHLKSIGDNAFSRSEIETVTFNDELTSIGNWAFGNCDYLQSIEVSNSVREMGNSVFSYCQNLQSVVLPSNLESFGQAIFNQCTNLKSVILPKRISNIPQYAFGGCRNLTDLYMPAYTPPTGTGSGLGGIVNNNLTLHIPQGSKSAYQTSSIWSTYNNFDEYYAYINVNNNGGGAVVIGEDSLLAGNWDDYLTDGDSFEIKLIPNDYYEVSNFTVNGLDASSSLVDNTLSITNLQESKNIQVAFAPKHFSVSVEIQGRGHVYVLGYDIEIGGKFEVTHDNKMRISAFPNEGYKLSKVLLNDSDITNQVEGGYAIYNPTQDMDIKVTFSKDIFKLTYMIGDEIYKETEYEFEAFITPEPAPEGDYKYFEWIGLPETMPAHDVVVTANYETGILEVLMANQNRLRIYSPDGKLLDKPQKGLNIIIMDNGEIKKVFVKQDSLR